MTTQLEGGAAGRGAISVVLQPSNGGGYDPFYSQMLAGISAPLLQAGRRLVLLMPGTRRERDEAESYLMSGDSDGAILVGLHRDDPLPERLLHAGIPFSLCGPPPRGVDASFVDCENRDGAKKGTAHLVAIGRRHIAIIGGLLDAGGGMDRLLGHRDALTEAGYELDPTLEEVADFRPDRAMLAMERLLLNHPEVDGVFVASDLMAAMAIRILRQYGRKVPDDVAVVGFDDSFVATLTSPPLTTLRQPIPDMAAELVRLLIGQFDGGVQRAASVLFPTELVIRESTGGLRAV